MSTSITLEVPPAPAHLDAVLVPTWQEVSKAKAVAQAFKIPDAWKISSDVRAKFSSCDLLHVVAHTGIMNSRELEITGVLSVPSLASKIANGDYTAEEVTVAFCKRAAIAHQLTNCLTEIFFIEAIAAARALDNQVGPKGPFHGIPISLKDQFNVVGQPTSIGYISAAFTPYSTNSQIVSTIISQGAIVYCKTNVPQTVMTADTVNNLFGRTLNPVNQYIIPGGSSGGESALLASGGSILGIGTDTGGSIRVPCAACELYGLKPSTGRISYKNVVNTNDGNLSAASVAGPMARDLDSLEYFMKNVISSSPPPWTQDHDVLPIPWRSISLTPETLTIGILIHPEPGTTHPCFPRILGSLTTKLRNAGIKVIPWTSPELSRLHDDLSKLLGRLCVSDGGSGLHESIASSNEPLICAGLINPSTEISIARQWSLNVKVRECRNRYAELWRESGVDALIAPTNSFGWLSEHRYANKRAEMGYVGLFNVLDYAVVNFPAGAVVEEELDQEEREWGLAGFKVGCQVVTRRLEEEKAIAVTRIVESVM